LPSKVITLRFRLKQFQDVDALKKELEADEMVIKATPSTKKRIMDVQVRLPDVFLKAGRLTLLP